MSRLDDYRTALLAAQADVGDAALAREVDERGDDFVAFIIDHGLGPIWHERTGHEGFRESRMAAEALFLAQDPALADVDSALRAASIDYAVIKGAATRLLVYTTPACRACFDIDLLVRPADRVGAATALVETGFLASPGPDSISRELVLSRGVVDIDLHWSLLREGRLRQDFASDMLVRRRRHGDTWVLGPEDTLFALLVHPAFAKHLAGWEMGLHRVVDLLFWLRTQEFDWPIVRDLLKSNGVCSAAWATLRWAELLAEPYVPENIDVMMADIQPGRLRRAWLDRWLRHDLSTRTSSLHWLRLLGFSVFLHDTSGDALRAMTGRRRARRRSGEDLAAFSDLLSE